MKTIERARLQQIGQVGVQQVAKATTGQSANALQAHLKIAGALLRGDQSWLGNTKVKAWLYKQAEDAGYSRAHVDKVIQEVRAAPSPEAAAHRYAKAIASNDDQARQGVDMARQYLVHETSFSIGDRLAARDQGEAKGGTQFQFQDQARYKDSRNQNQEMRSSIESALVQQTGYRPTSKLSLEEQQQRAMAYANSVADRLEQNKDKPASLRDTIEGTYDAEIALANKRDLGLSDDSLSSVGEREQQASAAVDMYRSEIGG